MRFADIAPSIRMTGKPEVDFPIADYPGTGLAEDYERGLILSANRENICYHDEAEVTMPEYVIEREIPGAGNLSDAELREIARKSVGILNDMGPKIKWLHSYVTGDKVYCVYLARRTKKLFANMGNVAGSR